jgi:hypothetical protein
MQLRDPIGHCNIQALILYLAELKVTGKEPRLKPQSIICSSGLFTQAITSSKSLQMISYPTSFLRDMP